MKCPHCEYEHGWKANETRHVEGDLGGFYCHPVELERKEAWQTDRINLYACPSCMKTFVE